MYFKLCILLYADDTIIIAETAKDMQSVLQRIGDCCRLCQLKVSISKVKIVIFP